MPLTQPGGPIGQQGPDQLLIAGALDMSQHKLAGRVDQFGFPGRLLLAASKAMPFIGLQFGHLNLLNLLLMIALSVCTDLVIQAPHRPGINLDQPGRALETAPIGQVLSHRDRLGFRDLTVPQRGVFPFAKLALAGPTTQVSDLVLAIHLSDG